MTSESLPPLEPFLRESTCYAGIGSRNTPHSILLLIEAIAGMLADYDLILRSGGAPGADTAFEAGCDRRKGKKEIFLPWERFNHNPSPYFTPPDEAEAVAALVHPNWRACKPGARRFHARNCQQVCGLNLDDPVDFVLFWAPEENGRVAGGTATAVTLARRLDIPTFNLRDEETHVQWRRAVIAHREGSRRFWNPLLQWLKGEPPQAP